MKSNSSPFKFVLAAALLQVAASSQKFNEPYSSDYEVKAEIKGEDTGADDYDMSGMNAPANVYQPDASGEEIEPASGSYEGAYGGAYGGYNNKPLRRKKCRSKPSEYPAPEPEYTPAEVTETPYTTEVEPEIYTPAETPYTTGVEPVPEEKTPCPQKTEIEPTDMPQATYTPEYEGYPDPENSPDPENYPEPDHTTEIAATPDESLYSSDAIKLTNMGLLAILGFFF